MTDGGKVPAKTERWSEEKWRIESAESGSGSGRELSRRVEDCKSGRLEERKPESH